MRNSIDADIRFSIVPEWVTDADVSDRAVRVYTILARYADNDTLQAFPSRDLIAARARCHVKSVDRAVEELITSIPSGSRPASRRNSSKFSGSLSYPGVVATPSVPSNSTPGRKFLGACTFGAGFRFSSISR